MRYLFSVFLLLLSLACCAAIYMQIDRNGNVVFTDTPNAQLKRATLLYGNQNITQQSRSGLSMAKEAQTVTQQEEIAEQASVRKPYVQFEFSSPVDQQTIQNQPIISVDMHVAPPLQDGDKIQIYLDGNPWGSANSSTHFDFTAPYRGVHSLSAKIVDDNNQIIAQTDDMTIYVHQAHLGSPAS